MMKIVFESFGYKYGVLDNASMVIDVRHLPNPYWEEELRPYCGLDECIAKYIGEKDFTKEFLKKVFDLLDPYFEEMSINGNDSITIGVGCTGGQHRSVFIAETLYRHYKDKYDCSVSHREMWRYKKEN